MHIFPAGSLNYGLVQSRTIPISKLANQRIDFRQEKLNLAKKVTEFLVHNVKFSPKLFVTIYIPN
jgi:hypothetical protein